MVFTYILNKRFYRLLTIIERNAKTEESLKDLCISLRFSSMANFSRMIKSLEIEGLIYRETVGREKRVFLTDQGKRILYHLHQIVDIYEEKFNKNHSTGKDYDNLQHKRVN